MGFDPKASRRPPLSELGRAAWAAGAMVPTADAAPPPGSLQERRVSRGRGWYATFFALAFILTVTVGYVTGLDAVAATSRFLWNATALITNGTLRAAGGLLLLLARGIGWRRLARLATAIMGVGLSYSGGIFLSERQLRRAKGWTGTLSALLAQTRIEKRIAELEAVLFQIIAQGVKASSSPARRLGLIDCQR
jgi:hypothetical protein